MVSEEVRGNWPLVSVIILNYNGKDYLEKCLESVLNTNYPDFEIILVDNASTDGSAEYAEKMAKSNPRIKLIRNTVNLGFAEGNNIGVKYAKGDMIALLNNDTEVNPNWLRELVKVMEQDSAIGVAQAKLLSYYNPKIIDSAGGIMDKYCFAVDRDIGAVDIGQYDRVEEVFSACFAAAIVRRSIIDEIGFLDPAFFAVFEDVDFCWRARLRGYKVVFVPSAIVYHRRGGTVRASGNMSLYYFINFHLYKNRLVMMIKNYSLINLVKRLPVTLLLHVLVFMKNILIKRDVKLAFAVLKSYFWVIFNLKYIMCQRRACQKIRRVPDNEIEKMMQKYPLAFEWAKKSFKVRMAKNMHVR